MDKTEPDLLPEVGRAFPSVANVYPEIGSDLTKVTWAHGVDSKKKLRQALRSKHSLKHANMCAICNLHCLLRLAPEMERRVIGLVYFKKNLEVRSSRSRVIGWHPTLHLSFFHVCWWMT